MPESLPFQTRWTAVVGRNALTAPLIFQQTVYLASENTLYALSLNHGSLLWQETFADSSLIGLQMVPTPSPFLLTTHRPTDPLLGTGFFSAYSLSGQMLWQWGNGRHLSRPLFWQNSLYALTQTDLVALHPDGVLQSTTPITLPKPAEAAPTTGNGLLFLPSESPHLTAVTPDGAIVWQTTASRGWLNQSPLCLNEQVFVASNEGELTAVAINNGMRQWQRTISPSHAPLTPPVHQDNTLFVGTKEGVYALDASNGAEKWAWLVTRTIESVSLGEQVVYATSRDHSLYVLASENGLLLGRTQTAHRIEVAPAITTINEQTWLVLVERDGSVTAVSHPQRRPHVSVPMNLNELRDKINAHFSKQEILTDICPRLYIDPDELAQERKATLIIDLLTYLQRRGRLDELIPLCQELRPNIRF